MRKSVVKKLKKEVTPNNSYKQLKKEYKAMKSATDQPKPKEKRREGQRLRIIKRKLWNKTLTIIKAA